MQDEQGIDRYVLKKYQIMNRIYHGASGIMWQAQNRKNDKFVALQKKYDAFQSAEFSQETYREIMYQIQFEHENIVKLQNVVRAENNKDIYLVFDYMESDLQQVMKAGLLQEEHKQYIVYQLLKVIKYIHSGNLVYKDLKPSKCLINTECQLKLTDFTQVCTAKSNFSLKSTQICEFNNSVRWYKAPEVLLGSYTFDKPMNMWAVGCILGELLGQKAMFPGCSNSSQIEQILQYTGMPSNEDLKSLGCPYAECVIEQMPDVKQTKSDLKKMFPDSSSDALDLLSRLLVFNPCKRITAEQCLDHPYLQQFRDKESEISADEFFSIPHINDSQISAGEYRDSLYREIAIKKKKSENADDK
ncbi:Mitogen-activated_protein kinase [Hexamita inflata]|uniref:Mitogen-activated protein kinase n=1 Tax=Hexamita inflata TaxID=28002 RepID=A0AA86NK63_9EUKA|nr:Mitogen-activated protein kinase [Hexamita inflata]CAI9921577.1 Mitogen-activated protein kinase [Hexamita inflata]